MRNIAYPASRRIVDLGPNNERLEAVAEEVAIDRGRAVVQAACYIAAIRSLQTTPQRGANAVVECVKAGLQDTRARAGQQAAHLLPGQIMVRSRPVWELADPDDYPDLGNEVRRLQLRTMAVFAETNILPAPFNRADSQAERLAASAGVPGLKQHFGTTMGLLWRTTRVDPERPLTIDRAAVYGCVDAYFTGADRIYRAAGERKMNASRTADSRGRPTTAEQRELEARVLETYHASFRVGVAGNFVRRQASVLFTQYQSL